MLQAMVHVTAQDTGNASVFGAFDCIVSYRPVKHPRLKDVRGRAKVATEALIKMATFNFNPSWNPELNEDDVRDFWLGQLGVLRSVHQLLEGPLTQLFVRDVRRLAKDLACGLEEGLGDAVRNVAELRAFVAVIIGEHDDEELGIEVVPRLGARSPRGPSVPFGDLDD